ncbi:hypothetical protein GCM10010274_33440 [Streptomyces lavendofoliae]|uniref:Uncharacterized protein n=1 Tax=Streptomyces lavendofoliae TaxID=67314 RepID=A0A918I0A2_9ACTN|nr:hypothetical protein GCM10010274_33440 [Streptomyces lavendofoliae]
MRLCPVNLAVPAGLFTDLWTTAGRRVSGVCRAAMSVPDKDTAPTTPERSMPATPHHA